VLVRRPAVAKRSGEAHRLGGVVVCIPVPTGARAWVVLMGGVRVESGSQGWVEAPWPSGRLLLGCCSRLFL
jgi:hypothetical protein